MDSMVGVVGDSARTFVRFIKTPSGHAQVEGALE